MTENTRCGIYDEFLARKLNGKVVNKYIDSSQHSYETIIIREFKDQHLETVLFDLDTTDAFMKININDSVLKEINNDSLFRLTNNKKALISVINFGCER